MAEGEAPKIHIDSDWKAEAQKEKEKLAEEAKQRETQGGQSGVPDKLDFNTMVQSMATNAAFALGLIPDPNSGQRILSIDLAKHYIDILGIIEEKTKGNLTDEETKMLSGTLNDLRQAFVEMAKVAREQAAKQGQTGQAGAPGNMGGAPTDIPGSNPGDIQPGPGNIQMP